MLVGKLARVKEADDKVLSSLTPVFSHPDNPASEYRVGWLVGGDILVAVEDKEPLCKRVKVLCRLGVCWVAALWVETCA